MLPFEDRAETPRRLFPFVTIGLLLANVAVFIYMVTLSQGSLERFVDTFGVVPDVLSRGDGAGPLPFYPYITLLTALFIHGGFVHILGNLIFLWVFGDNVESALGHLTYLVVYLASGALASLAQVAIFPTSTMPTIGASGAIAGVLGAYLLMFPRAQVRVLLFFGPFFAVGRVAALFIIFGWFALQVFRGVASLAPDLVDTGGVAYMAHVAGFLAGGLLTAAVRNTRHEPLGDFTGSFRVGWTFRNWLLAVVVLSGLLAAGEVIGGSSGALLRALVVIGAALFALIDAARRVLRQPSLLGSGRGVGRLMAAVQLLVSLGVLAAVFLGL